MRETAPSQANYLALPVVFKASGEPVTTGTVTFYLKALTGTNAGKWFRSSDSSWQSTESSAGAGTYIANGHWTVSVVTAAWTEGVQYYCYAQESGGLHIPSGDVVLCRTVLKAGDPVSVAGAAMALGPTAPRGVAYYPFTVYSNGTWALCARIYGWDGQDITASDIATITYTIYKIGDDGTWTQVANQVDVSQTVADVVSDVVVSDGFASDYNLKIIPDISTYPAFEDSELNEFGVHTTYYVVEATISPSASGEQDIICRWKGQAI